MNKLTYPEAYDKIIQAYFKDEIQPLHSSFCFCGTLSPNDKWAFSMCHSSINFPYSVPEYEKMEKALFSAFPEAEWCGSLLTSVNTVTAKLLEDGYEDKLFAGMSSALDALKQIHKDRGENVDDLPALTKRELKPVI